MPTRYWLIFALAAIAFLFSGYLPPAPLYLPYDIAGYHYPLADYAFQSLKHGRWPVWDAANYSGFPLTGNVQAQLFYPPLWLFYATQGGRAHVSFLAYQWFVLLHVWLAWAFAFHWLRRRALCGVACAAGACVFAVSGYMMTQLQHVGLAAGFAWWPLAFEGLDRAREQGAWRPLWKVAVASAMVCLAGYVPFWAVFAVCVVAYAPRIATVAALGVSLAGCAVQLLPAFEAARFAIPTARFGLPIRDPLFYVTYVVPNYWDFALTTPAETNPGLDCWYLGALGIVGLLLWPLSSRRGQSWPALRILAVCAWIVFDPFLLLLAWLAKPSFASALLRNWYFLAGATAAIALLAALGIDHALRSPSQPKLTRTAALFAFLAAACWQCRALLLRPAGPGWQSAVPVAVNCVIVIAGLWILRGASGRIRAFTAAGLLAFAIADYRAFGAGKRFNATTVDIAARHGEGEFSGMNVRVLAAMQAHPEYRVAIDDFGPSAAQFRSAFLASPQGMDPLLSRTYRAFIASNGRFTTDRDFLIDPANSAALDLLGVRYYVSSEPGAAYKWLRQPGNGYHLLEPDDAYFRVFERDHAAPVVAWDARGTADGISVVSWRPTLRKLRIDAPASALLRFSEQYYPGWYALVDGRETALSGCHVAFQCAEISAGQHTVEFRYRPRMLVWGALISLIVLAASWRLLSQNLVKQLQAWASGLRAGL